MRRSRVTINNFRRIEEADIHLAKSTFLIGQNNFGKSSVIRPVWRRTMKASLRILGFTLIVATITGCTTHLRNKQLESVAKDWSYVVRASQVIPVYPLTEDLQPGDVLLVSVPVEEQAKNYKEKGFLPLDQLLKRMNPNGYKGFYLDRYLTDDMAKIPPARWQETVEVKGEKSCRWESAPHVAFPAYNFEVSTGTGMNLAVPVQGVPIALGFMNSGKASGSLTIEKAYTYGLDNATLYEAAQQWGALNRSLLRGYGPREKDGKKKYQYLRVISRVYAVGDVSITMINDDATSAQAAGGADKDVSLEPVKEGAVKENFDKAAAWNKVLQTELPGGKVKFASASHRAVSMKEEFSRPLIIGYAGFDLPIMEGGRLGLPISTLEQLTGAVPAEPVAMTGSLYRLAALTHMNTELGRMPGNRAKEITTKLNVLGELLPGVYPFTLYETATPTSVKKSTQMISGAAITRRDFQGLLDYLGNIKTGRDTIERCLLLEKCEGADRAALQKELTLIREASDQVNDRLATQPAIAEAVEYVFLGY